MKYIKLFEQFISEASAEALPARFKSLRRKLNKDAIEILVRVPKSKNRVSLKKASTGNWNLSAAEKKQVEENLKKNIPVIVTPVADGESMLSFEVLSMKKVTSETDNVDGTWNPQDIGRAQFKLGKTVTTRKRDFGSGTLKRLYGAAYEFIRGVEL